MSGLLPDIAWDEALRVATTLFFIMDPLGNIPIFNTILKDYPPARRRRIIMRELSFALVFLMVFLYAGTSILKLLGLTQPSLNLAGGILLFLIAIRMLYPENTGVEEPKVEDPFIVPLAMPLIVGPSTIAVLLLISSSKPDQMADWTLATLMAWSLATLILVASPAIMKILGDRGLRAVEKLMGMLLVLIAVQMFLNGLSQYLAVQFPAPN
ncbi:MAG: MarC family protein [Gammaproteobacteria bacterium]|nr:MarC family protein [Gammaproteobacteria bacterium]